MKSRLDPTHALGDRTMLGVNAKYVDFGRPEDWNVMSIVKFILIGILLTRDSGCVDSDRHCRDRYSICIEG